MQQESVTLAQVVLESHAILADYGASLETEAWSNFFGSHIVSESFYLFR